MNRHMHLRVRALTWEAEGILGIELVPLRADIELPPFTAGAHIDLNLPTENGTQVRSYSLLNDPAERHRYCVAVLREASGKGGSRWIHTQLRPGQMLRVSAPRNHFELDSSTAPAVFIAGGIGITPIMAMLRTVTARGGRPWALHYAARSAAHQAFVLQLQALVQAGNGELHLHRDDERGGVLDVPGIVGALPPEAHVYACGPRPMLLAFEQATAALTRAQVHLEYFGAADDASTRGGFSVKLRRSDRVLLVRPGQSILEACLAEGLDAMHSCRAGVCGTCEVAVLAGEPDHRDLVLTDEDKAANRRMMICCSGSKSPLLEIDL